jgi:hypothetical protein
VTVLKSGCQTPKPVVRLTADTAVAPVTPTVPEGPTTTTEPALTGQWLSYQPNTMITNPTYNVVSGTAAPQGGCLIPSGGTDTAGGPNATEVDEIALNLSTCSAVEATGVPPASVITQVFGNLFNSPNAVGSDPGLAQHDPLTISPDYTVYQAEVEFAAVWQDDIDGRLNEVGEGVTWRYNGGCTTENVGWSAAASSGVGWTISYPINASMSRNCGSETVTANEEFQDGSFCNGNATYNVNTAVQLQGQANGDAWDYKSGFADGSSCASNENFVQYFNRDYGPKL